MEEERDAIEDLMRTHGYDQKEVEAAYHLSRARGLIGEKHTDEAEAEVEGAVGAVGFPRIYAQTFLMSSVFPHFDALESLLTKKVLARQYPEGRGRRR
jgi:phenylalanyl-tRNA synthetase beta subunit